MYATNKMMITFTNHAAANCAKKIASRTIQEMNRDFWFRDAAKGTIARMLVSDTSLVLSDGAPLLANEMLDAAELIVKTLAVELPQESFTFDIVGTDTYAEGWLEGRFTNGTLEMTNTYYPEGYCEYVSCPECGEFIVRLDEYDPSKTYVCPHCGEEVDLSENYESCKPDIKRETVKIR